MFYLHGIYTSCPEVQKTRRTGNERDTLLVDAECIILLNNNTYSATKKRRQQYYGLVWVWSRRHS